MTTMIQVENATKAFTLSYQRSLKQTVLAKARGRKTHDTFNAVDDVSFTVREGESVGLMGLNGSGKSTLLKLISGVMRPDSGSVLTRGRIAGLIATGTGFDQNLSGRENLYLNAAILGMSRRDVRRRYDEIVEFSGLERFLDTPLKRYSWGMYLRLAFAVAAHVEPEIVIVDEVLAVGDARFREKCLGKMSEFGREGRTVVFVSHDLGSITQVCRRAVWLDAGRVQADGPSEEIVQRYVRGAVGALARADYEPDPTRRVQILHAAVTDDDGKPLHAPERGRPLTLAVRFAVREPLPLVDVALSVRDRRGITVVDEVWGADTGSTLSVEDVPAEIGARVTLPPLLPAGDYVLGVWIGSSYDTFLEEEALRFRVWPRADDPADLVERDRLVHPDVTWSIGRSEP